MYLIFDVTPIEKPKNYQAPFTETYNWPRMIHISWILLDQNLKPIEDYDCVVKPEGFTIDSRIEKFARLDEGEVDKKGAELEEILNQFEQSVEKAEYLIAHNMDVNEKILAAEYMRKGMHPPHFVKERVCLMQEATYFCKLPSKTGGYKWPTLQELYTILFKQKYTPANNARADVIAAARCFIMLKKGGILEDVFDQDE